MSTLLLLAAPLLSAAPSWSPAPAAPMSVPVAVAVGRTFARPTWVPASYTTVYTTVADGDDVALVPQIGSIMRAYGQDKNNPEWDKAATLQDLWHTFPVKQAETQPVPGTNPVKYEPFDYRVSYAWPAQTGIDMDWIFKPQTVGNNRAKAAYDLLKERVANDASGKMKAAILAQVNRMLTRTGANTVNLGSIPLTPGVDLRAFHFQQVQFSAVETSWTDALAVPDPLLGALGTFNFYAIPVGTATRQNDGTVKVQINSFMTYVIDSFDFTQQDQHLGYFRLPDVVSISPVSGFPPGSNTKMENKSFRLFREASIANGTPKGGDFLVITNTRTEPWTKQYTFTPQVNLDGSWTSNDARTRFDLTITGNHVRWIERSPEVGNTLVHDVSLTMSKVGDSWRIERPNTSHEVLKVLGYGDEAKRNAILAKGPQPSTLVFKPLNGKLVATWSGIRYTDAGQLLQPGAPGNASASYTLVPSS